MILKNKLTKETLDIPYSEFRKKFAKEIQIAFESYRKKQLNKYSWNFKDDNSLEFNFILNSIGILIILEIQIGILKNFKLRLISFLYLLLCFLNFLFYQCNHIVNLLF